MTVLVLLTECLILTAATNNYSLCFVSLAKSVVTARVKQSITDIVHRSLFSNDPLIICV